MGGSASPRSTSSATRPTPAGAAAALMLVSAGTGAFENAKGKVDIEGGDPPTYVFDLDCE